MPQLHSGLKPSVLIAVFSILGIIYILISEGIIELQALRPSQYVSFTLKGGRCDGETGSYRTTPLKFTEPKVGDFKILIATIQEDMNCGLKRGYRFWGVIEIESMMQTDYYFFHKSTPKFKINIERILTESQPYYGKDYFNELSID